MILPGPRLLATGMVCLNGLLFVEIARDVARQRQTGRPLRLALSVAAGKAAAAARWCVLTVVAFIVAWVGVYMVLYGFVQIFHDKPHVDPTLAWMLPGSALVAVGIVGGWLAAAVCVRELWHLHHAVGGLTHDRGEGPAVG